MFSGILWYLTHHRYYDRGAGNRSCDLCPWFHYFHATLHFFPTQVCFFQYYVSIIKKYVKTKKVMVYWKQNFPNHFCNFWGFWYSLLNSFVFRSYMESTLIAAVHHGGWGDHTNPHHNFWWSTCIPPCFSVFVELVYRTIRPNA